MVVVKIYGGLGNQMFQYAFGKAIAANGIRVTYDLSWFNKPSKTVPRPFTLDKFDTDIPRTTETIRFWRKNEVINNRQSIREHQGFNKQYLFTDNSFFVGYWQYLAYYKNIWPTLRKEFKILPQYYTEQYLALKEQILSQESVSLHIRRGDYVTVGFPMPSLAYYLEALQFPRIKDSNIFIFSDDIPWCKSKFDPSYFDKKITFVSTEHYLDMELMSLCTHNIIAVSTFSWWAAILNQNSNKVVVAPKRWLVAKADEERYNNLIHYPKDWKTI